MFCWLLPESSLCSRNVKIQSFLGKECIVLRLPLVTYFYGIISIEDVFCFHENPAVLGGFSKPLLKIFQFVKSQSLVASTLDYLICLYRLFWMKSISIWFVITLSNAWKWQGTNAMPGVLSKCHSPPGIIFTSQL